MPYSGKLQQPVWGTLDSQYHMISYLVFHCQCCLLLSSFSSFLHDIEIMQSNSSLTKTLPASWFRSAALYQLERRAVFLKVDSSLYIYTRRLC